LAAESAVKVGAQRLDRTVQAGSIIQLTTVARSILSSNASTENASAL
jgi:hypothetical protein